MAIQQGVLFLQIQTGNLLPLGFIESSSIQWQAPPSDLARNYLTFDYDTRSFALGDVFMDDHILTGVKFEMHDSVVGKRLININIGQLEAYNSGSDFGTRHWKKTPIPPDMDGRKIGIDGNNRHYTIDKSEKGGFLSVVKFTTSDEETDGGQTTVPYFDGTSVELDMPKPLSGVGFIHYTNTGYSGFIRPILKTFNYKNLIPSY